MPNHYAPADGLARGREPQDVWKVWKPGWRRVGRKCRHRGFEKKAADYVCDGRNDEVELNQAVARLRFDVRDFNEDE